MWLAGVSSAEWREPTAAPSTGQSCATTRISPSHPGSLAPPEVLKAHRELWFPIAHGSERPLCCLQFRTPSGTTVSARGGGG